ncbi:MAG: hypothetical protein V1717_03330 [Candidatus Micrarchaeota archaeon]
MVNPIKRGEFPPEFQRSRKQLDRLKKAKKQGDFAAILKQHLEEAKPEVAENPLQYLEFLSQHPGASSEELQEIRKRISALKAVEKYKRQQP